jgi:sn-glycerol 3-phosphate transport system substrate-binding protein
VTSRTFLSPRSTRRLGALGLVAALGVAACSSGDSALQSGAGATTTTTAPEDDGDGNGDDDGTATTLPAPTTTVTPLADLPPCPVDALDDASGPVEILFWHAMSNELETALIELTNDYNASQDRVRVRLENQIGYEQNFEKYIQSSQSGRPDMVQHSEVAVQVMADSGTVIPMAACIEASGFDTSVLLDRVTSAYTVAGVQWSMPFNVSNPVLYYNKRMYEAAGLDPETSPITLEELREYSQALVDSGASSSGIALDTGTDSGGGWFIEQWFAKAGELYSDNDNGRAAPSTRVLYDGPAGVELLTFVQDMINDGLAVNVGDNAGGQDNFLKMADPAAPAAMTIGTSAALGTVTVVLDAGLIQGITGDDLGVGPMPGPEGLPGVLVGGASLYVVADKGDAKAAGAWDYIQYLVSPESQSTWAALTGYVPINAGALDLEPLASKFEEDPRFKVAYDQLLASTDDPAASGPVLGPQREVRSVTARAVAEIFNGGDVQAALNRSAELSNALLADYIARN